jgi:F-type H+-transporting ATPase subunit delta
MNAGLIAHRYARALLKYAKETQTEDLVYSQVSSLVKSFQDVPKFRDALERNPDLSLENKLALIGTALNSDICEEFRRFIRLVDQHSRMVFFSRMLTAYMERYREMKNIRIGTLIIAAPQEDLQNRLESMVSADMGGTVNLSTKVDESLIGGFVLQVGDLRMDASVAGQFQRIRNALIENDNRII